MTIARVLWLGLAAALALATALLMVSGFADIPCQDGNWNAGLKTCVPDGR